VRTRRHTDWLPRVHDPDMSLPAEDIDEVLLGLLARDAEPPPYHRQPYRRWTAPPRYWTSTDNGGQFTQIEPGWWRVMDRAEQREQEKGRNALELERRQRAREYRAHLEEMLTPPVDYFVENLRVPGQLMPDWLIEDLRRNGELWPPSS